MRLKATCQMTIVNSHPISEGVTSVQYIDLQTMKVFMAGITATRNFHEGGCEATPYTNRKVPPSFSDMDRFRCSFLKPHVQEEQYKFIILCTKLCSLEGQTFHLIVRGTTPKNAALRWQRNSEQKRIQS